MSAAEPDDVEEGEITDDDEEVEGKDQVLIT
jgi:hypothetical protein